MLYGRELYFGRLHDLKKVSNSYNCIVMQLFLNNVVDVDGKILLDKLDYCLKKHLWIYILYLLHNNPGITPFNTITFDKDMYEQIRDMVTKYIGVIDYEFFLKRDLARFINSVIENNSDEINIGFIDQMLNMILKKINVMDSALVEKYNELMKKHTLLVDTELQ